MINFSAGLASGFELSEKLLAIPQNNILFLISSEFF